MKSWTLVRCLQAHLELDVNLSPDRSDRRILFVGDIHGMRQSFEYGSSISEFTTSTYLPSF